MPSSAHSFRLMAQDSCFSTYPQVHISASGKREVWLVPNVVEPRAGMQIKDHIIICLNILKLSSQKVIKYAFPSFLHKYTYLESQV